MFPIVSPFVRFVHRLGVFKDTSVFLFSWADVWRGRMCCPNFLLLVVDVPLAMALLPTTDTTARAKLALQASHLRNRGPGTEQPNVFVAPKPSVSAIPF